MFDMPIIEVAIGLTFMFLVLSFCATAIAEALTEWRQWRGRLLHGKLLTILGPDLVAHFYCERRVADLASGTPVEIDIKKLAKEGPGSGKLWSKLAGRSGSSRSNGTFCATSLIDARELANRMNAQRLPSYIPESVFADVMLDWLQGVSLPDSLLPKADSSKPVDYALAELWQRMNLRAGGDQVALRAELVTWYRQVTDRTTGEFKRRIRVVLYAVGFVLVLLANADAVRMVRTLYGNPQLRAQVASMAEDLTKACPDGVTDCPKLRESVRGMLTQSTRDAAAELLGWVPDNNGKYVSIWSPAGWLLTILAIGLGADFWFGALKKVIAIKNTKSEAAADEARTSDGSTAQRGASVPRVGKSFDPIDINDDRLAALKGFQPLRFTESSVHAFWMAQFASLAYRNFRELDQSDLLLRHGLAVEEFEGGGTQAFIFSNPQSTIVAFRGTEQALEDWVTDADVALQQLPWKQADASIAVHRGFRAALDRVWPKLRDRLMMSNAPVWFTGHSLGGALAVLAAYRLSHFEGPGAPSVGGVYTFGQPRVGNSALARSCSLELTQRIFRFVNASDIVPLVPPSKAIDYSHFGNVRYFDASGHLHYARTLWERVSEQLMPALREMTAENPNWRSTARDHLRQRISDHAMARYIQCLERVDSVSSLRAT